MRSQNVSYMRGRRIRATRVDAAGRAVFGDSNAVVTKGFVTLTYTTNTEEGEAIAVTNAAGEVCVSDPATPTFNGFGVEAEFCNVDFALFNLLTGQDLVLKDDGTIIGLEETTDVDLLAVNFALELWTGAQVADATPSVGSQGWYGYVLTPFLSGGVIGDLEVTNGAVTFTVTGMATRNANTWGSGPYAVELVAGAPAVLSTPLKPNAHRRIMNVEVAPPAIYGGSVPVLDPTDAALTGITATPTGLSVSISPTPAGTDPVWYDFGDGEWDYAETGSYTHVYDAAGQYTITGRRGSSVATTTVTVAAV